MYDSKTSYKRFPRVPNDRRIGAFAIDFLTVWFISSFFGVSFQWLVFILVWLGMRVVLGDKNQGQSLGKWALDIKVIDPRFNRVPSLVDLAKREGAVGIAAMLATIGLQINFKNGLSMLLLLAPLLVDCAIAIADENYNQALHDRLAQTAVTQTKRGFSLDLRLKKIVAQIRRSMQK
ncbi:RDD family protein [Myxosarcina sp. GI1]|uniref:RDD family protein n=1 Tax=Myxosarcina sp. GI1 TaxID=1541065 RepID=UPI000563157C|nr:RDD family protein [Myxosarcina sp. GI1]